MLYDDELKNPETGKPLTPEEAQGVVDVVDKLFEVTSRSSESESDARNRPWDGS